jgi:hypothetical protein
MTYVFYSPDPSTSVQAPALQIVGEFAGSKSTFSIASGTVAADIGFSDGTTEAPPFSCRVVSLSAPDDPFSTQTGESATGLSWDVNTGLGAAGFSASATARDQGMAFLPFVPLNPPSGCK